MQQLLTKTQLAEYLQVSVSFINKSLSYEPNKIPAHIKVGRLVRFPMPAVEEFMQQQLITTN